MRFDPELLPHSIVHGLVEIHTVKEVPRSPQGSFQGFSPFGT